MSSLRLSACRFRTITALACFFSVLSVLSLLSDPGVALSADAKKPLARIETVSSVDGAKQPSMFWAPESAAKKPTPLLVFLHSWSGDYRQNNEPWLSEARKRGWIFLHPNFRGANFGRQACGSEFARRDILDAMDQVTANFRVDRDRIYLAGVSGGGHMTMLMAGYYPNRFSAASAWVGISDLAEWYRFHVHDGKPARYAQNVAACCGGAPGASKEVDRQYRARSPLFHLDRVGDLPIELCAGIQDGHTGSVPIAHTLDAFNVIAASQGHEEVAQSEIDLLSKRKPLAKPRKSDTGIDADYGREIKLRREAGPARVTIFEGGHEGLPHAACAWLAKHRRATRP